MSLFNLIEKHHGIRLTPYSLGKLATLIISHIARRRTYETADGVTLLIFAHVNTGHHVLIIEQELGKSLRKLSLTDTGRSHEQE